MRIQNINPNTSPRFAPQMTDSFLAVVMRNNSGEACPEGGAACFDNGGTTYTDGAGNSRLFGYDFDKPATANLMFWLGCATRPIGIGEFGEVQIYGYMPNALVTRGGAADPDLGDAVWPINGAWALDPGAAAPLVALDSCWVVELEATMVALGTGDLNIAVYMLLGGKTQA